MPRKSLQAPGPIREKSLSDSPKDGKKAPLSELEKKRNHIYSEKHRRNAIEAAFRVLAIIVPDSQGMAKSENKLLARSLAYARHLAAERERLIKIAEISRVHLDDLELETPVSS